MDYGVPGVWGVGLGDGVSGPFLQKWTTNPVPQAHTRPTPGTHPTHTLVRNHTAI